MNLTKLLGVREVVLDTPYKERIPLEIRSLEYQANWGDDTTIQIDAKIVEGLKGKLMLDTIDFRRNKLIVDPKIADSKIQNVIFNDPATIVIWSDNTKTIVKCQEGDTYDKELGLAMCIAKKYLGNKGNFNDVFKKWIPEDNGNNENNISLNEMRACIKDYCENHSCRQCPLSKIISRGEYCYSKEHVGNKKLIRNYNIIKKEI